MSNIAIFRNYLENENVYMEEIKDEDGTFFRTRQSFDNGGSVTVVVEFNKTEELIDLKIFGIANIQNPLKKESLYELLNNLNSAYRFTKFIETDGNISAHYSLFLGETKLDPYHLTDVLLGIIGNAEESYPKFMRLQWA
ncbi:YbjN domain-containing protein [Exiguobacterium sp. NPDC077395]|uniref:YbjN domain-containing protein n=1 Tax=Exiguobacterium sp. NPDC077395 TaxID=3390563 RepID=UPI003D090402